MSLESIIIIIFGLLAVILVCIFWFCVCGWVCIECCENKENIKNIEIQTHITQESV